ncbi:MAG: hypothetical protein AB7F87_16030 [Oligoflexales bacterium]
MTTRFLRGNPLQPLGAVGTVMLSDSNHLALNAAPSLRSNLPNNTFSVSFIPRFRVQLKR